MSVLVRVSDKVKGELEAIKEEEEHTSFDSVIRTLLSERNRHKMVVDGGNE